MSSGTIIVIGVIAATVIGGFWCFTSGPCKDFFKQQAVSVTDPTTGNTVTRQPSTTKTIPGKKTTTLASGVVVSGGDPKKKTIPLPADGKCPPNFFLINTPAVNGLPRHSVCRFLPPGVKAPNADGSFSANLGYQTLTGTRMSIG